jgi:hypothetical protein
MPISVGGYLGNLTIVAMIKRLSATPSKSLGQFKLRCLPLARVTTIGLGVILLVAAVIDMQIAYVRSVVFVIFLFFLLLGRAFIRLIVVTMMMIMVVIMVVTMVRRCRRLVGDEEDEGGGAHAIMRKQLRVSAESSANR